MKMIVSILQMDIAFGIPEDNYNHASKLIEKAAEAKPDVVLLPELWTTGYDLTRLDEIADAKAEKTITFLAGKSRQYGMNFVGGSIANRVEGGVKNTLLITDRKGNLVHQYSKLHLFKLMDEHHYLAPGEGSGAFELDGRKAAGFICYDIRFPEWLRKHAAEGAEALFVVAEWPKPRLAHWRSLLIARAIENQCYVIACNRSGSDPKNVFAGHSLVVDPWGEVIAEAGEGEEILVAEIDLDKVKETRGIIPVFEDRRTEFYK